MANDVPADWESRAIYIAPRTFPSRGQRPYNLFGLKGESTKELKGAWLGTAEVRYGLEEENNNTIWKRIWPTLSVIAGAVLVVRYFVETASWSLFLAAHQWIVWLALAVLVTQFTVLRPSQKQREAIKKAKAMAKDSGMVTVLIEAPKTGMVLSTEPRKRVRRKRGDRPQWSRDLGPGYVAVTLEGLSEDEAQHVYKTIDDLTGSD